VVIVDEAHHTPARTFREVLSWLPAKYRFGLTATPKRSDGLTPMLLACIGPELHQVPHEALIDDGHLIIPSIVPTYTGTPPPELVPDACFTSLVNALVEDENRNALILSIAEREIRAGHSMLILSGRVEHCNNLAEKLCSRSRIECVALTAKLSKKKRVEALDRFRSGELRAICATSLADEGLDVARLERLILATPSRSEGRTIQRLGRLMRPFPGKKQPVLYDLVDQNIPTLLWQSYARRRAYRKVLGL